jgi:hypothetical protein
VIHILNWTLTLPDGIEIGSDDRRRLDAGALRVGQIVALRGRYSASEGFAPVRLRIRSARRRENLELQGRIEEISRADRTFRLLGITVAVDDRTELSEKAIAN